MSHRHRRYSKRELLGSLHVDYIMSVTDLGLSARTNRWDVLRAFLAAGEARAERLVEEEDGFLILQSVPGEPNTGGIYLFAEPLQSFFWLRFDVKEDTLNGNDFQIALRVYHLLDLIGGRRRKSHGHGGRESHQFPAASALSLNAPAMAVAAC
ncbi:MAG: hypothetical protein RB191_05770 [Terriglobia bacterium]|nr:hypothetical protein [Terriglobia bacterium]